MSAPLQPLGDYVVAVGEEAATKTASGIYLPENAQEKPKTLKVVGIGKAVSQIKVGDRVVCKDFGTTKVKVGKDEYVLVREEDILATVK